MNGNSVEGWKQARRVAKLLIMLSLLLNPLVFGQTVPLSLSKARSALAATAVGNLVIFGGGNECNNTNTADCASSTVDIFNVTSRTWSTTTLSGRRYYLCATTVGNIAMFAGGTASPISAFNNVDIYDAASDSWSTATLTQGLSGCHAATLGTRAFVAEGNSPDISSDSVYIFDSTTEVWTSTRMSVARIGLAVSAVPTGNVVLFAGGRTSSDTPSKVVDIFNATSNSWRTTTLSIARWDLTATTVGNVALFAGGTNTTDGSYVFNQVDIYHSSNDTWTTATLSTSMSLLASGAIGNFAYFAGPSTIVDIYNVLTNVWTTTTLQVPRQLLAVAATHNKIFFGGGRMTSNGEASDIVEEFDLCDNCVDDGIFCNGEEYCDVVGRCISPGDPCSSGSPCNNTCNELARNCFTPNRTNCDDSIFCNGEEYCDGEGHCVHSGDPCQGGYCHVVCNEQPAYCLGMECTAESDVSIVNINITLNGDTKNCTLCGRNDYACSTDDSWQPKQQFNDPSNEGYIVTGVTVTAVDLKWCNNSVKIYLQDLLVGATLPNLLCPCDACPQSTSFTAQIDPSWTGYNYAGINTISIDGGGSEVCLGTLQITLTFTKSFDLPMDSKTSENSSVLIIILVFVLVFVSLSVIVILFIFHKKILHRNDTVSLADSDKSIYLTDITIHESLGGGNFGEVFRGTWHGSTVALKLFKSETDYIDNEIQLLKKLNHSNIVRYFGIHVSSEMISYIVMEFMQYGNLNMFLQSKKASNELNNSILIDMTFQAAAGMMYLEEQKIIHRDLAARNLLATKGDERHYVTVKVADFGLSREVERGYYKSDTRIMPYKWCPPESIQYGTFTTKSDVWAFGVSMWEIFSYGQLPYQSMSNSEATEFVLKGNRLKIPDACPQQVYDIMMQCWMSEPEKRPSFQSLEELLKQFRISEAQLLVEPAKDSTAFYNE